MRCLKIAVAAAYCLASADVAHADESTPPVIDIDFGLSTTVSSEAGARNLGVALSDGGVHVQVQGKVQHNETGILIEAATGNHAKGPFGYQHELAIGKITRLSANLTMRTDGYLVVLDGDGNDEYIASLRLGLITTKGDVKPYFFVQQFLSGPPGEGTAVRVGTKLPEGFYVEAGVHFGLFNQDGLTYSFSRFGIERKVDVLGQHLTISASYVDGRAIPVRGDRTEVSARIVF